VEIAFLSIDVGCAIGYGGKQDGTSLQTITLIALTAIAMGTRTDGVENPRHRGQPEQHVGRDGLGLSSVRHMSAATRLMRGRTQTVLYSEAVAKADSWFQQ
jgi:hypothetical protein